jgi:hypothetical protein
MLSGYIATRLFSFLFIVITVNFSHSDMLLRGSVRIEVVTAKQENNDTDFS